MTNTYRKPSNRPGIMLISGGYTDKRHKPCQKGIHNPVGEDRQIDNYNTVHYKHYKCTHGAL